MSAPRALAGVLLALALLGLGYWWGDSTADTACIAQKTKELQALREALERETQRADAATAKYLQEKQNMEARYAALDQQHQALRKQHPLTLPRQPICPDATAQQHTAPALDAGEPALTLAAVRMWNNALRGDDAPAGACGLAGATESPDPACSEDSGLTLDDAWINHADNARSCAEDRQQLQHLINFLNHQ